MINANGHDITNIYKWTSSGVKSIIYVYKTDSNGKPRLVWQAISSCFGSGLWNDSKLWIDDETWKNNQ